MEIILLKIIKKQVKMLLMRMLVTILNFRSEFPDSRDINFCQNYNEYLNSDGDYKENLKNRKPYLNKEKLNGNICINENEYYAIVCYVK